MSILSQLLEGKISLATALSEVETWWQGEMKTSPVAAAIGTAAGNAAALAGTAFGTAAAGAVGAVEAWTNAGITAVLGSTASGELTPSIDLALTTLEQQAVAAVQAEIAAFRSKFSPAPAPTVVAGPVASAAEIHEAASASDEPTAAAT